MSVADPEEDAEDATGRWPAPPPPPLPGPLPPPVALPPPPAYDAEVAQLANMGFTDAARSRSVLQEVGGSVEAAIGMLVNM